MPKFRTLKQVDVKKKRALVRVDLNVPLGENLKIDENETWRIEAIVPTIKYLIRQKARIILISHLGRPALTRRGRPNGKKIKKFSLKPVAEGLSRFLKKKIIFSGKTERMKFGDVLMLENIRFYSGEEKNSPRLAKELAGLGDIFINEAFSVSHRKHASIVGIPQYLPSAAGFLFEKEIKELNKILKSPKRPLITIIGGAKILTKIKLITKFLRIADKVLIGGALANTIFASKGISMGDSVIDVDAFGEIKKINPKNPKLFLPIDLGIWDGKKANYRDVVLLQKREKALDVGPKTIDLFCDLIKKAKMIVWNGPLGFYTQKPFDKSSIEIVKAIAKSKAYSVAGGGDTAAFLRKINKEKALNHLSTGGGAMLDYLANETLPGIEALNK